MARACPTARRTGRGAQRQKPGTPSLLRELNDRAALELLLADGPLTRAQLSERTGVSKVTVSQMLARLEERGLVMIAGEQAGGRGPNAALYSVVPLKRLRCRTICGALTWSAPLSRT